MNPSDTPTLEWLFDHAGPIIRWRLIRDFDCPVSATEREAVRKALLESPEVRRWLENLGGPVVHGSKDTDAENPMAKLVEYGLRAGLPELDAKMLPYAERVRPEHQGENAPSVFVSLMGAPFLIAAGYADHPAVREWFLARLDILHATATQGDYDLIIPPKEMNRVPSPWRAKSVFRPKFYEAKVISLPTCYDLYAMAHWACTTEAEAQKIEAIVAYLSDPRFQAMPNSYLWDGKSRSCLAAGRVFMACLNENRKVLFLELAARFAVCRNQPWFRQALAELESHRTDHGTYCFPSDVLQEKRNKYYLYSGGHMGLGEPRRSGSWREIESTFRMLNIQRLMDAHRSV